MAKREKTFSIVIGDRINICVTCDIWLGHHFTLGGSNCVGISQDDGYVMGRDVSNSTP